MGRFESRGAAAGLIGAIDLGTAKVGCLIAAPDAEGRLCLLGFGHQRSQGVKSGVIVSGDDAERAVRLAVGQAERMAGVALERVVIGVNCGRLRSATFTARAAIRGTVVTGDDVDRIIAGGEAYARRAGQGIVQLTRTDWRLDEISGVPDPRGLAGRELRVQLTAITADEAPVRNLIGVLERCHLAVDGLTASPFASAVAVTTAEERRGRVLVVDLGAGTTSMAAFAGGRLVYADGIPTGGHHVTFDIARGLGTSVAEAERIKTLYGTLIGAPSDEREMISYPGVGEESDASLQVSKAGLRNIIGPRVETLLDLVADRLRSAGIAGSNTFDTVLTGGGSQLAGLDQVWKARFGGMVRVGRSKSIGGMPGSLTSPAFATLVGLVLGEAAIEVKQRNSGPGGRCSVGYLGRVRAWVRESF